MKSKHIIVGILCAIMFSGCKPTERQAQFPSGNGASSETVSNENSDSFVSESEADHNQAFKIGDLITTKNWEITVDSVEVLSKITTDYGSFEPDEGNKYVVANVTAKNIGKEASVFFPTVGLKKYIRAKIVYGDYGFSGTNLIGHSEDMHDSNINPLSIKSGIMAFSVASDVADNTDELSLVFSEGSDTYTVSFAN